MEKRRNFLLTGFLTVVGFMALVALVLSPEKVKNSVPMKGSPESKIEVKAVEEQSLDVLSPDGTYTLTLKNGRVVNGVITQTFLITSENSKNPLKIYEKETNEEGRITIPDNTFSPNNKFIFLKYNDAGKTRYVVLRTDGSDIKEGSKSVEIESLFSEAHPDFVITDVTGWGANSLIVVNTNDASGKIGPSWWFDLSNFGFIRLSTRFN